MRAALWLGVVLAAGVALAGCSRVEPKAAKVPAPPPALAARPTVGARPLAALPDYAKQAQAQTEREQRQELQARVKELKVEVPPKRP